MIGQLVDIGFSYQVAISKIYSMIPYGNSASKALLRFKGKNDDFTVIKCTRGHKAKTLILMDNGGVFVSPLTVDELKKNITEEKAGKQRG